MEKHTFPKWMPLKVHVAFETLISIIDDFLYYVGDATTVYRKLHPLVEIAYGLNCGYPSCCVLFWATHLSNLPPNLDYVKKALKFFKEKGYFPCPKHLKAS